MPKLKTHRGMAKRAKVSARRKVMIGKAGKSHLMTGSTSKQVRQKRRLVAASKAENKKLLRMLGQG